ncbi:hypothetical protein ACKKBF_B09995 [Auxenochlorella protothecoides x Auxenochlorella symbiontica]
MGALLRAWLHPEAHLGYELPDPIKASSAYFVLFMLLELAVSTYQGKKVYNLRQSLSNLSAGFFLVFLDVFTKALFIFPYSWLRSRVAIIPDDLELGWLHQVLGFLIVDHSYYWFHRTAHMSNLGWAAHVTHHSSNDYNLSTALRQGVGESMYSWAYYLVLAPFAPLKVFALHKGANVVIQFWVHTEMIPKLWAPLEYVFNTPSHHRVHHARNYGRRNFGGVLIVWDRLYGTFEDEDAARPCVYGLDSRRVPLGTYSPLWAQAHHLAATLRLAAASAPLSALLTRRYGPGMVVPAVVDAPAGAPPAPAGAGLDPDPRRPNGWYPWERRALGALDFYAALHLLGAVLPGALALGEARASLGEPRLAAAALAGIASLVTAVWVMDGSRAALRWELARLAVLAALGPRLGAAEWLGVGGARAALAALAASGLVVLAHLARAPASPRSKAD